MGSPNLPVQLTSFVGREREIADISRQLSHAHIVTLTGPGGIGKTRLAIEIANTISETFADGVWLVDLAPWRDPTLVPLIVAQVLGLRPDTERPIVETLQKFLQAKQLLLILDNCEHLGEASAQLARELLSQAPTLRILATSGEPLAVAGETIYPVSGLGWPSFSAELKNNLQNLKQYDAVRLFVERAVDISPNFALTAENAWATVEICRRLDGLPLALELASARINVLAVDEINARLDDRLALLISTQRQGVEPRHQTLRAAIDWSYTLLSLDEQIFLRRLAVFEGGWTLDLAKTAYTTAGVGAAQILDWISSLVSKSFVIADTLGRTQARYGLLETIREYALEKLEEVGKRQAYATAT